MKTKCSHHRDGSEVVILPDGTHFPVRCPGLRVDCFVRALWMTWWKRIILDAVPRHQPGDRRSALRPNRQRHRR